MALNIRVGHHNANTAEGNVVLHISQSYLKVASMLAETAGHGVVSGQFGLWTPVPRLVIKTVQECST